MQVKNNIKLPDGRLLQSQPDHRLQQNAHAGQLGDGSGHGLHVIGAVFALGAVAESDDAAEDARQNLAADKEAEGKVHVGGRDGAERAEDEESHGSEKEMVFRRIDGREKRPGFDLAVGRIGVGRHFSLQYMQMAQAPAAKQDE